MAFILDNRQPSNQRAMFNEDRTRLKIRLIQDLQKEVNLPIVAQRYNKQKRRYQFFHLLQSQKQVYFLIISTNEQQHLEIKVVQSQNNNFKKLVSTQQTNLFLKHVWRIQRFRISQFKYYVYNDCLTAKMHFNLNTLSVHNNRKSISQLKKCIDKALEQCIGFFKQSRAYLTQKNNMQHNDLQKQLSLMRFLNRIVFPFNPIFGVEPQNIIQKQQKTVEEELKYLGKLVNLDPQFESAPQQLFVSLPQQLGVMIRQNFVKKQLDSVYNKFKIKNYKKFSNAQKADKTIQDFNQNSAKIEVKSISPYPINEGGSSYIFFLKANVSFISSTEGQQYNYNTIQKDLVVKKLKENLREKLQMKIDHEKAIIKLLKGGCSSYIPCYYQTPKETQFADDILMEAIYGQELNLYVKMRKDTISIWTKIFILCSLAAAMNYIQEYNIVHLDLKPSNIIISKMLIPKIIDFGEAYNPHICPPNYLPGFTFPYVAPELFKIMKQKKAAPFNFSQKQDVFAFGVIMYQMIFCCDLFSMSTGKFSQLYQSTSALERVMFAHEKLDNIGPQCIMSALIQIMFQCLHQNPEKRPKFVWLKIMLTRMLQQYSGR